MPTGMEIARGSSGVWCLGMPNLAITSGTDELNPTPCNHCAGWAESPAETLKFLQGERQVCAHCPLRETIEVAARQYNARSLNWWVVKGVVAIPVWIKEQLRNRHLTSV